VQCKLDKIQSGIGTCCQATDVLLPFNIIRETPDIAHRRWLGGLMRNCSLSICLNTIIFTIILTLSLFVFNKNVETSKPLNEPDNRLAVFSLAVTRSAILILIATVTSLARRRAIQQCWLYDGADLMSSAHEGRRRRSLLTCFIQKCRLYDCIDLMSSASGGRRCC